MKYSWFFFFFPAVSSRRQEVKAKCSLTCEYLTEEDYTDLLWTTLSEFPGKGSEKHQVFLGMAQGMGLGSGSTSGTGMSALLLPTALRAPWCSCGFSLPWDHSRKKNQWFALEWLLCLFQASNTSGGGKPTQRGRKSGISIHKWLSSSVFKGWWVQWIHGELVP